MIKNTPKTWIIISAYDVSSGKSTEGFVAYNVIKRLLSNYRIILITRKNNVLDIRSDEEFLSNCNGIKLVGYDLPLWTRWWKKGARFYQLYAYLWQLTWPFCFNKRRFLISNISLVHVLNFHNDSIPSLAWLLKRPVVWGPINHNELVPSWRRKFWPWKKSISHQLSFVVRRLMWLTDPFLKIHSTKCHRIMSAGTWVDKRLGLLGSNKVVHRSQLGVDTSIFQTHGAASRLGEKNHVNLVCAGRLDWIKGVDLLIEAVACLPEYFRLKIIGNGPSESMLMKLAHGQGVRDRVIFQSTVTRSELVEVYADSDIFVFPSAEAAGLVWIEALVCGLPVVTYEGPNEAMNASKSVPGIFSVTGGDDRLVQIAKLACKIDEVSRISHNKSIIREMAIARYDWDELASCIQSTYKSILVP